MSEQLLAMQVIRKIVKKDDGYYVVEHRFGGQRARWIKVSKAYNHSTSAFAAMGRLQLRDLKEAGEV